MDRLLIVADDFTGSLDTGIQFTKMGIRAKIISSFDANEEMFEAGYSVYVVNTDSRHAAAADAAKLVKEVCSTAKACGITNVYKKTDSGLRGNVGAEIVAAMEAYDTNLLCFIPALPRLKRITKGGVCYIDGVPVNESVFGRDPFEPVTKSDVADILNLTASVKVVKVPVGAYEGLDLNPAERTVLLFDAETQDDLNGIAKFLAEKNLSAYCSGCAGFAASYGEMLQFEQGRMHDMQATKGLMAVCGSVNQITIDQLTYAGNHGFTRENLQCFQKLDANYFRTPEGQRYLDELCERVQKTDKYALDTLDTPETEKVADYAAAHNLSSEDVRVGIASNLGLIVKEMVIRGLDYTFSVTGGDTLMGFMHQINAKELVPICEIGAGAVLSALHWNGKRIQIISKSGGFGEEDIFEEMYKVITSGKDA